MGHINPLYDFAVGAFIEHAQRLLLLYHKKLQVWINVGGHVEPNEDPEMALWREIFEETGLQKKNLQLIELNKERPDIQNTGAKGLSMPFDLTVYFSGNSRVHRHIDFSYMMKSNTDVVTYNPRESNAFGWFTQQQLEALKPHIFPNVYIQCCFALHKLSSITLESEAEKNAYNFFRKM